MATKPTNSAKFVDFVAISSLPCRTAGAFRGTGRRCPRRRSRPPSGAGSNHEPHQLAHYLRELANDFHTYYNAHQFLVEDGALRNARLNLIQATRQVLANGLGLLGVSAPDSM